MTRQKSTYQLHFTSACDVSFIQLVSGFQRTDHGGIVNARKKKEEDLGLAIAKARDEESIALLNRRYVRENAPELKTLTKNLRSSYVSRDQKQQILRNQYKRFQEKVEFINLILFCVEAMRRNL